MSKSEGGIIALTDEPREIRRKVLALDDGIIATIFQLCTEKDLDWIKQQAQDNPREFKETLAEELITMYHGKESAGVAATPKEIKWPKGKSLSEAIVVLGDAQSSTAAKALIDQGGVRLNGKVIEKWDAEVNDGDELQIGKGKFYKIKKN